MRDEGRLLRVPIRAARNGAASSEYLDPTIRFCRATATPRRDAAGAREKPQDYFSKHAAQWDRIRKLHAADDAVEGAIVAAPLTSRCVRCSISHRTGRMLELFGPSIERGSASISRPTCCRWRVRGFDRAGLNNAACARRHLQSRAAA